MSVNGVLAQGRAAALKLLRDTCVIERRDGDPVLNQDTGELEQLWTAVYQGICRVRGRAARQADASETEWGEREVTLGRYIAILPWSTTQQVRREDRLRVLTSDDTWLIGRNLEVIAVQLSGTSTARRLLVEDKEG